jgi:hypothetical protein
VIQIIIIAVDKENSKKLTITSSAGDPSCPFAATFNNFPALKTPAKRIPNQLAKVP